MNFLNNIKSVHYERDSHTKFENIFRLFFQTITDLCMFMNVKKNLLIYIVKIEIKAKIE